MLTYVFFRGEVMLGIISCSDGMTLTDAQKKRIEAEGITILQKLSHLPKHDGDVNRLVDTLVEKDWI